MEPQTSTGPALNIKYIIIGTVMLVVSSAIGAVFGPAFSTSENSGPQGQIETSSIQQESPSVINTGSDVRTISGIVTAINGGSFVLHVVTSNSSSQANADRTIFVTNQTKITKTIAKDTKTLDADMRAFTRDLQSAKTKPHLVLQPDPFTSVVATAAEISVGDGVTVTSNENISIKKDFVATEIQFHSPVVPPVIKK